jgi:voltage-gated potassium channel
VTLTTLTTLGYGEITPATPYARALSNLEAIFGQFYIAILVAALVGIHIANRIAPTSSTRSDD